jgi:hypothetical protein
MHAVHTYAHLVNFNAFPGPWYRLVNNRVTSNVTTIPSTSGLREQRWYSRKFRHLETEWKRVNVNGNCQRLALGVYQVPLICTHGDGWGKQLAYCSCGWSDEVAIAANWRHMHMHNSRWKMSRYADQSPILLIPMNPCVVEPFASMVQVLLPERRYFVQACSVTVLTEAFPYGPLCGLCSVNSDDGKSATFLRGDERMYIW